MIGLPTLYFLDNRSERAAAIVPLVLLGAPSIAPLVVL